jgi:putative CocE/NonD family hydrolase
MRRPALVLMVLALLCAGTVQAFADHEDITSFHYVTVSDGEEIAVKVFLPPDHVEGQRYPVLFTMEGYGGAGGHNDSTFNHAHDGYVLVAASLRGTGCSGGQLDLFSPRSSLDGAEIIEDWLPTQEWYDPAAGVGIFGHSYAGLTGFLVAAENPAGLEAVAVSGLIDDFYRGVLYPGGVPNPGFPVLWGGALRPALEHQANADELQNDPKCQANYAEHAGTHVFNPANLVDTYGNREATPDSWAIQRGLMRKVADIRVPIQLGQQYQDEQTGPRGGHVLWEHLPRDVPKRFVVSTGRHNPNDPHRTKADWLDCWVRSDGDPDATSSNGRSCAGVLDEDERVLAYFESMGSDRLAPLTGGDWPLPQTEWTRLHLRADGTLGDIAGGDGTVTYLSSGTGRQLTADVGGLGSGGLGEVTYQDGLPDTARYELAFDETTALAGPAMVTLWASATSADVDFWVEVLDVDLATGAKTFVQRGLQRASLREADDTKAARVRHGRHADEIYRPYHDFIGAEPIVPGEAYEYQIEVFPFGHVFRPGHAMVVQVHAPPANDPISTYAYEPNQASVVTILQGPGHRSSILLPFLPELPSIRPEAPACGEVIGEICLTAGS